MSAPNNEELEERVVAAEARLSALTARVEHCSQRCSRLACASSPALEDAVADKLERCIHMFCTSKARQRAAMPTRTFKGDLEEFLPHLGQPPQPGLCEPPSCKLSPVERAAVARLGTEALLALAIRAGGGAWVLGSDGDCIEARPTEAPADEAVAVSADLGDDLDAFASGGDY
jgi:hypothetical protein